jgi:transcriptional regulator with XRE-family HTH domain
LTLFPYVPSISYVAPTRVRRAFKANGPAIAAIREARGISVGAFANRINKSYSYVCNIEAGRKPGSPEVIRAIADELNVPLDAVTIPVTDAKSDAA